MKRAPRSLLAVVLTLLLVIGLPAAAGARVTAAAPEAEPNDVPSQANAMLTNDIQGTIDAATDSDDVFSAGLAPLDEIEIRLVLDWSGADPVDVGLNLYPPGTSDAFDSSPVEYSSAYGLNTQFIRYRLPPGGGGAATYYPDVYAGDTHGATVPYEIDYTINDLEPISGVERYWGDDRYGTALDTSYQTYPDGGCSTVVIATGTNFPDALSASGLAGANMCPLLLTPTDRLYGGIADELLRLGANHVYIVGGAAAVNSQVEQDLVDLGMAVDRIAGADRYQTAAWVAEEVISAWGAGYTDKAFVVRGDSFPDALAAAPFSYGQGVPILLTRPESLHSETEKVLDDFNVTTVYIVGGTAAVAPDTQWAIDALNGGTTVAYRFGGNDRYQTAAMLANDLVADHGMNSFTEVGIATGRSFPDALAGGAAAGYRNGVILLTTGDALNTYAASAMEENMFAGDDAVVFGGNAAIQTTGAMEDVWEVVLGLP